MLLVRLVVPVGQASVLPSVVLAVICTVVLAIALAVFIQRRLIVPIGDVTDILTRFSDLDLDREKGKHAVIYLERSDEVGAMVRSLGRMANSLREIIGKIIAKNAAETVKRTALELGQWVSAVSASAGDQVAYAVGKPCLLQANHQQHCGVRGELSLLEPEEVAELKRLLLKVLSNVTEN